MSKTISTISLHFEKYKYPSPGLQRHNERKPGQKHSNKNIRADKTKNNIFLKQPDGLSITQRVNNRIKDGYKKEKGIRSDAIKLIEATVQLGGEIGQADEWKQILVLEHAYEELKKIYGEENIVSAVIHVDETTPHLHMDFVPLTKDGRLSARDVLGNKGKMKKTQENYLKSMQERFPELNFQRKQDEITNGLEQKLFEKFTHLLREEKEEFELERDEWLKEVAKLEERERALEEKEQAFENYREKTNETINQWRGYISKERHSIKIDKDANEQKAKELQEKELKLKAKEKELLEQAQELEKRESDVKEKETEVKQRETEIDQRETEVKQRETKVDQRETDVEQRETAVNRKETNVQAKETLVKNKEERLGIKEQNLERKERKLELDQEQFNQSKNKAQEQLKEIKDKLEKDIELNRGLEAKIRGLSHALGQTVDKIPQLNTKLVKWAEKQPFGTRFASERIVKTVDRLGVQKPLENIKENIKENSIDIEQIEENRAIIEDTVTLTDKDFDFLKEKPKDDLPDTVEAWNEFMKDIDPRDNELTL
jgi:myosin heavy subunit